ncbi:MULTISPECIES: mycofactocin-coupled SDR family oxidoreductase [unclassified Frankia]|uniref:mycofactocin-coupled SDR family oxidoreductase n=1 Tax=unclassified Frankia TaxID=2632575 RepID=UPI0027DC7133|nr:MULTISPECIES: mycofactocin-coupled SDR family oxidoreductase [unclassified Frankia]
MAGQRFVGKVAVITGAARGQGRALAVRLAREGADLIALDICAPVGSLPYGVATADDLAETEKLVRDLGRQIVARPVDVRDLTGVEEAVRAGVESLGRLDYVAANAGVISYGRVWELTPDQWRTVIDINLTGVWHTVRATVPTLIEQNSGGAIVITSSVAGLKGLPLMGHYAASKYGVVGLAQVLANELGEHQIRVNTIHPWAVHSGMSEGDSVLHAMVAAYPRLGPIFMSSLAGTPMSTEEVAGVTTFLFSDEARHITGVSLPVDFGTLAR